MYLEYYVGRVSTYFSNFPREGGHETGTASLPVSRLPVSDFPGRDETLKNTLAMYLKPLNQQ